jgi:Spy/CpxP family protein refolding chaperone
MKNVFIALAIVLGLCLQSAMAQTDTTKAGKEKVKAEVSKEVKAELAKISKELQLTADQNAQIKTLLTEEMEKLEPLRKEYEATTQLIRVESRAKMRAVLTPDQQKHWDMMKQTKAASDKRLEPVKVPTK